MRLARDPLLYLVTPQLLITVYAMPSERIFMPVTVIFRFLVLAVRSSLRCGTPQPELAASGPGVFKAISLAEFVRGERSECSSPLTTQTEKEAGQGWMVSRSEAIHLQDALAFDLAVVAVLPLERFCAAKSSEYTSEKWPHGVTFSLRFST